MATLVILHIIYYAFFQDNHGIASLDELVRHHSSSRAASHYHNISLQIWFVRGLVFDLAYVTIMQIASDF